MQNIMSICLGVATAVLLTGHRGAAPQAVQPATVPATPLHVACPDCGKVDCPCGCGAGGVCTCSFPSWASASGRLVAEKRNCVVFVGTKPRKLQGVDSLFEKAFSADWPTPGVVVGVHRNGRFERVDLPTTATDEQIAAALKGSSLARVAPQPVASPPQQFFGGGGAVCRGGR